LARNTAGTRRSRLIEICAAFPEAVATQRKSHIQFTVRKKTFAYYVNYPHEDRVSLCVKAPAGEQSRLVASDPQLFFVPAYLGPKGWVSIQLDLPTIDWNEIERLIIDSYQLIAPKGLAALI
jgi:predicted DNA-binding protein (MmcQ/YjbR family)